MTQARPTPTYPRRRFRLKPAGPARPMRRRPERGKDARHPDWFKELGI